MGQGPVTWPQYQARTTDAKWHLSPKMCLDARDYGATGDGSTDDTAALQAAITETANLNETLFIPRGVYRTTQALSVPSTCKIVGAGVRPNYGSIATDFNTINLPISDPVFLGTVIVPTTPGQDGIAISGTGSSVDVTGIGIVFDPAIRFANTGYGIKYIPPVIPSQTYRDNGLIGALWDDVAVYGVDGGHYAFYFVNPIYNTMRHLRAFGGGALLLENNGKASGSGQQYYGNTTFDHFYAQVFVNGSAHGIRMLNTLAQLNLCAFIRPQVSVCNYSSTFPAVTPPAGTQKMFYADPDVKTLAIFAPDFETNTTASVTYPAAQTEMFISGGGFSGGNTIGSVPLLGRVSGARIDHNLQRNIPVTAGAGTAYLASINNAAISTSYGDLSIDTDNTKSIYTLGLPGALKVKAWTTASRPSAVTAGAGVQIFDSTLNKPIWSTGSAWVDAAGNVV